MTTLRLLAALVLPLTIVQIATAANADDKSSTVLNPAAEEPLIEQLADHARELAKQEYLAPRDDLPQPLADMQYDAYKAIRYRAEKALWHDQALFEVQLFHPGFLYRQPVGIHVIDDGKVRTVEFSHERFTYGEPAAAVRDVDAKGFGYAGFRVHYPINSGEYKDEVVAFLGASYFRVVGRGQHYGLSARGLAINTATPQGEEFPAFRQFWLVRPEENATQMTFYALLDSPSITGAYRFDLSPGQPTTIDIDARLFAREDVDKLGIAPMTSMFYRGENSRRGYDDFRPEIHDSDGLLMHTRSEEWIWRPLMNPFKLRVTGLQDERPRGFGLMQRDRAFENYLDLEAHYHERPDYWVKPTGGDWGEGAVELVEIPSDAETNDNITAYWSPHKPPQAGDSLRYRYRLETTGERLPQHFKGKVVRTRFGSAAIPGDPDPLPAAQRRFIVDFEGGELGGIAADQPVKAELQTSSGKLADVTAQALPGGGWRAAFRLIPDSDRPADIRLFLSLRGQPLTETWTYVYFPEELR